MRPLVRALLTGLFLLQPFWALAAAPSEQQMALATVRLEELFRLQEASARPVMYDAAIARERGALRALFARELELLIDPAEGAATEPPEAPDVRTALEKQQDLVRALEQRESEANVDLDLLQKEDRVVYGGSQQFGSGTVRLTASRPELLAKAAVLEEEIAAIAQVLPAQQERLDKLRTEQRLEQFSLVITIGRYLLGIILVIALERALRLRALPLLIPDRGRRYAAAKVLAGGVYGTLAVYVIVRLTADYPGFLTSFAIIGAALAVALQDVVKDMLSWMLTVQSQRYQIGDRIAVGQWTGDVIDISPLRTTVLEVQTQNGKDTGRTGRVLAIPNAMILNQPLINYNTTSDFLRMEQHVLITFQSDWKLAREILQGIVDEETGGFTEAARVQEQLRMRNFYVSELTHGPSVYVELGASGILLMMRFYAPVGQYRSITSRISENILTRFAEARPAIELAYPTSRAFATTLEPGEPLPDRTEKKG